MPKRKTVYNSNLVTDEKWERVNQEVELKQFTKYKVEGCEEILLQGVGYNDIEGFSSGNKNYIVSKAYSLWHGIISRCYSEKSLMKHPAYKNVTVCEEWLTASNFYKWFLKHSMIFELTNIKFALDKDLLSNDCKIYSPSTCIFLPTKINAILARNTVTNKSGLLGYFKRKRVNKDGSIYLERWMSVSRFYDGKRITKYFNQNDDIDVLKERIDMLDTYVFPYMREYLLNINTRLGMEYYTEDVIEKIRKFILEVSLVNGDGICEKNNGL